MSGDQPPDDSRISRLWDGLAVAAIFVLLLLAYILGPDPKKKDAVTSEMAPTQLEPLLK